MVRFRCRLLFNIIHQSYKLEQTSCGAKLSHLHMDKNNFTKSIDFCQYLISRIERYVADKLNKTVLNS
jgi:hypothetical protein